MEGLQGDLLARDDHAAELLGVRLHSFDAGGRARAARVGGTRTAGRALACASARAAARCGRSPHRRGAARDEPRHRLDPDRCTARRGVADGHGSATAWAEWVTIHRKLVRADDGPPRVGFTMDQQLQMRGVHLEVHWRLAECRPCELAVWEGRGPGALAGAYRIRPALQRTGPPGLTIATSSIRRLVRSARSSVVRWWEGCPSARHSRTLERLSRSPRASKHKGISVRSAVVTSVRNLHPTSEEEFTSDRFS